MSNFSIFISYFEQEFPVARAIGKVLERLGICRDKKNLTLAKKTIGSGEYWTQEIWNGLESASVVLVLMSRQSLPRPWINIEAGYSLAKKTKLVPLCMRGIKRLPRPFDDCQARRIDDRDDVEALLNEIATGMGVEGGQCLTELVEEWMRNVVRECDEVIDPFCFFGCQSQDRVVAVLQDTLVSDFQIRIHLPEEDGGLKPIPAGQKGRANKAEVFADVLAANAIAQTLARIGLSLEIDHDGCQEHLFNSDQVVIAIGLHNGAAYKARHLARPGSIDFGVAEGQFSKFCLNGHWWDPQPGDLQSNALNWRDRALIVRAIRRTGVPYFVCGGRDGQGTAAAGVFLAKRWHELMQLYAAGSHSLEEEGLAVVIDFDHRDQNYLDESRMRIIESDSEPANSSDFCPLFLV